MIKDENFIHISGWMINRLGLKGNELLVYAIIYGFSQDGETWFEGSRKYLADMSNIHINSVDNIIDKLCKKDFLERKSCEVHGHKFYMYRANLQIVTSSQNLCSDATKIVTNNIVDNKDETDEIARTREEVSENFSKQEPAENHPSCPQDVVDFAAQCGVPITLEQAERFINKNSITAQGSTWIHDKAIVRNWRAIANLWMPAWRKYFLDGKKTETASTAPAEPEDEYQKKRCPALEKEGYKWIPQEKRYETWSEMEKRTSMGINPYNLK